MALKLGTLQVDIGADTSDLKKADKEINKTASNATKAFKSVGVAIAAAISVESARRIILIADNMKVLERRLVRFTGSASGASRAMDEIVKTSNSVGSSINSTTKIFERFSLIKDDLGATNDEILQMTDTLSKLGAIGGSSQEEISNSLTQLSQGLAGGVLRAEEFNSIIENTPEIARAIGREMGLSLGQMRKAMLDGELTSAKVFRAIQSSAASTNKEFDKLPKSISMATQALQNELSVAIRDLDAGLGISEGISTAVSRMAELVGEMNKANAAQREFEARQERINDLIGGSKNRRGRGSRNAVSQDVQDGREVNALLEKNIELEKKLTEQIDIRVQTARGMRVRGTRAPTEEELAAINEEIRLNNIRIEQLKAESQTAAAVAAEFAAPSAKVDSVGRPAQVKEALSDGDQKRIESIRLLGETEREEVLRLHEERTAFILSLDQLEADQRAELLESINNERFRQLRDINDAEIDEERRKNEEKLAMQREHTAEQIALVTQTAGAIANMAAITGDNATANIANTINQVAGLATTISTIMAAQAQAQAAASPEAITVPQKVANIAIMASQFAGIFASINAAKGGGRRHGGYTSPSLVHEINEAGTPEILNQAGKQYLLPTGKSGTITPLKNGGAGTPNVTIISNGTPQTITNTSIDSGTIRVMINDAVQANNRKISAEMAQGRGDIYNGLRKSSKIERNLNG